MKCVDIPEWLKGLPLAPEFRPTDTEFADPIAYISKIEKEASAFGICKVIPPLPKPSRKYVAHNLNKSLSKCPELGDVVNVDPEFRAVFTTRNQELGKTENNKQKQQVWQSGQVYTLEQFEAKSKNFARTQLGMLKEVSPEIVEAMFWKSSCEEPPIYFEYANDVPGSAFGEPEGLFHRRKRMRHNKNVEVATPCNAGQVEGTAGWKLANSPWNLQVIARSPGSLTRFMPHDIPGVTSPMIYIGMLFSWFAWHVEDHELHSLNFLHMGSPKTWYAVPGDYAFSFEEVIRCHAYGVKTDRLAALTLLGEKTTLLSPEAVVASGIPCCRLVQNPGEFVVTFPRAYHVGFSHGFNCGEAANLGTPQWLTVAKEAAVRRAAMNYLPMLSHQQLLYLLTVSFVSSVPRSFLPGCRSSRLRDRQKEERELLVKKAFVEDIEKENNLVEVLLEKSFCDNAVLWDVEMLPSSGKGSVNVDASRRNNQSNNNDSRDLLEDQLSLYVENCSDFYVDDDDVSSEFQIDSGTLPCVACGILGFPFMALVQPSKKAAKHFLPVELDSSSDHMGIIEDYDRVNGMERNGGRDEVSLSTQPRYSTVLGQTSESHHTDNASLELEKEWDVSKGFLRPRIFCLEHAIQTEQLLHAKGGANILVICHSDFQKMRAHATIVAEEIGTSLTYNEISLANASQGYLSLIDLAIEDEERDKCAEEDWTLKLNINLRHCVKVQRNCPLKKLKHALVLGGLFSDKTLTSDSSSLKWQSTKVRTKRKSNDSTQFAVVRTDKVFVSSVDRQNAIRRNITIQYSRKRYKSKACSMNRDLNLASQGAEFLVTSDETQAVICTSSKSALEDKTDSNSIHTDHKDTAPESSGETEIGHVNSTTTSVENFQDNRDMTESGIGTKSAHLTEADRVGDHCGEAIMDRSLEPINSSGSCDQLIEDQVPEQSGSGSEASNSETLHKIQMDIADQDTAVSDHVVKEAPPSVERSVEVTEETSSPESGDENVSEKHNEDTSRPTAKRVGRRSEVDLLANDECNVGGFIKSPCEGLRPRARKHIPGSRVEPVEAKVTGKKGKRSSHSSLTRNDKKGERKGTHRCDLDGCTMSFKTKVELQLHKRNFCPIEGCGKQFTSHKYARIHQRVHEKDRPLKCPWKGCTMTFKWAWARIEHLRVHTGERPYKCKVEGCGLTFRFVSDYSRHRRKTGHYVDAAS